MLLQMVALQIWSRDRRRPLTGASVSASGVTLMSFFFFFPHHWDTEICKSDVNEQGRVHKTLQSTLPFQSDSLFFIGMSIFFFFLSLLVDGIAMATASQWQMLGPQ